MDFHSRHRVDGIRLDRRYCGKDSDIWFLKIFKTKRFLNPIAPPRLFGGTAGGNLNVVLKKKEEKAYGENRKKSTMSLWERKKI